MNILRYKILLALLLILIITTGTLLKLGYTVKFFKKEIKAGEIDDSYYTNHNKKPELKICTVNTDQMHIYGELKFIKEIFEEMGYFVRSGPNSKNCDVVIDSVFGSKKIVNDQAFKIYFTGEAEDPKLEGYDLSLGFNYLPEHKNYIRLPLYYLYFTNQVSDSYERGKCNPNKQHFACFLVSNGFPTARSEMFKKLSEYKKVASGGKHLNNIGYIVPSSSTNDFLSQCKFILAYENNTNHPGYITEKVFQAYYAGATPLYSSDPDAVKDTNKDAIIYRGDFKSDEDMINYIKEVDQDDEKYCKIWNNKIINDPKRNYQYMYDLIRKKIESKFKYRPISNN